MNIFSEEQSETSSQYLAHENQSKTMKKRPPTNLKLGHGSRKGSWSTKRNEHKTFIQGITPKTKLAPAADHIQPPEGSLDIQTESTDQGKRDQCAEATCFPMVRTTL